MASFEEELSAATRISEQRASVNRAYSNYSTSPGITERTASNITALLRQYPWMSDAPGLVYQLAGQNLVGQNAGEIALSELRRQVGKNPNKFDPKVVRTLARGVLDDTFRNGGIAAITPYIPKVLNFVDEVGQQVRRVMPGGILFDEETISKIPGVGETIAAGPRGLGRATTVAFQSGQDLLSARLRGVASGYAEAPWYTQFLYTNPLTAPIAVDIGATVKGVREGVKDKETPGEMVLGAAAGVAENALMPTVEQNTAGQIALALARGEKVDIGSGIMPDLDSRIAKAQAAAARQYSPSLIGGHAWTPGRWIAGGLFDADETAFTIFSGTIDALVAWKADPTNAVMRAVGDANSARKTIESAVQTKGYAGNVDQVLRLRNYYRELEKMGFITSPQVLKDYELSAGLLGRRGIFEPVNGLKLLVSDKFKPLLDRIVKENDPVNVWWAFAEKIPFSLAEDLAATTTTYEAERLLAKALGTEITTIPSATRFTPEMNRWKIDVPEREIDPENLDGTLRNIQGMLVTAKARPELISETLNGYVEAVRNNEFMGGVRTVFDGIGTALRALGADGQSVREMTRIFKNEHDEVARYWIDALTGDNQPLPIMLNGQIEWVDGPMLQIERFRGGAWLPDARDLRALANEVEFVRNVKTWGVTKTLGSAGDFFNTAVFKPLVLLRAAWTVRVVGEEMLRVAAGGSGGIFQHPVSYLLAILGDSETSRLTNYVSGLLDRQVPLRQSLVDYFQNIEKMDLDEYLDLVDEISWKPTAAAELRSLYRADPEILTPEEVARGIQTVESQSLLNRWVDFKQRKGIASKDVYEVPFDRDDQEGLGAAVSKAYSAMTEGGGGFGANVRTRLIVSDVSTPEKSEGILEAIWRLRQDADVSRALRMTPDEFKAWGNTDQGIRRRTLLASGRSEDDPLRMLASNKEVFDSWVDGVYARISDFTQNNPNLIEALRRGRYTDSASGNALPLFNSNQNATKGAKKWIASLVEDPNQPTPQRVTVYAPPEAKMSRYKEASEAMDKATRFMFNFLGAKPTNFLNRSPEYRLWYWKEMEDLIPSLRESEINAVENALGNVNLLPKQKDRLQEVIATRRAAPRNTNPLSLADIDRIAKKRALDQVQSLLYDLSKRNQFADSVRVMFPFAEAWKEMMTTWAKLLSEEPQIASRFYQIYSGARESEFDPITGLPTNEGVGFFHYDPMTKQEVFSYPGVGWLTDKLGLDIPPFGLTGSVKGLNMLGNGMPSVGPVVSVPAGLFLPNKPQFDTLREIIFPYGMPEERTDVLSYFLPAWSKRVQSIIEGPQNDRIYMNTVFDVSRYLVSTGEYEINGQDAETELVRLFNDAKDQARWLYWVRAATSYVAPSSPAFRTVAEDKDGNLVMMQKIIEDYQQMKKKARKEGRPNADAFDEFLNKWGTQNVLLTTGKSDTLIPGLSSTIEQRDWQKANSDLVQKYPNVWALFAPEGKTQDISVFTAQIKEGFRRPIAADTAVRRANDRLASHLYQRYSESLDNQRMLTSKRNELKREFKQQLLENYPGYTETPYARRSAALIVQVEEALSEPRIANSVVGRGLADYFELRAAAQAKVQQAGLAWPPMSDDAAPVRDAMIRGAEYLKAKYPGFDRVWYSLLQSEFDVD